MKKALKFPAGLIGALCGPASLRPISRTGLTYEFAAFMLTFAAVAILMDSAVLSYGTRS